MIFVSDSFKLKSKSSMRFELEIDDDEREARIKDFESDDLIVLESDELTKFAILESESLTTFDESNDCFESKNEILVSDDLIVEEEDWLDSKDDVLESDDNKKSDNCKFDCFREFARIDRWDKKSEWSVWKAKNVSDKLVSISFFASISINEVSTFIDIRSSTTITIS